VFGDVFGHDGACPDNRTMTDAHAWEDHSAASYPHVVSDPDWCFLHTLAGSDLMRVGIRDCGQRSHSKVVPDVDLDCGVDGRAGIDQRLVTYAQTRALVRS
jgi:hypothetical protein